MCSFTWRVNRTETLSWKRNRRSKSFLYRYGICSRSQQICGRFDHELATALEQLEKERGEVERITREKEKEEGERYSLQRKLEVHASVVNMFAILTI